MKYKLSDKKAKDTIIKTDKSRSSYYNYYTNKKWGDAQSYNLCIDSSKLGIESTRAGDHPGCRFSTPPKNRRIRLMKFLIQRVLEASVKSRRRAGEVSEKACLFLVGAGREDDRTAADKYLKKLLLD